MINLPIVCIIDDAAPCINTYWWHAAESQNTDKPKHQSGEPIQQRIPLSFLREFVDVTLKWGIKGKFSVLPYPAGLGSIAGGLLSYPKSEVDEWVNIVRQELTPFFDITPEILTHAKALDLSTMTLLPENERNWATHQTEATLTPYIAYALQILKDVGLDANGVTSPWDFGRPVESDYQRAILNAQKLVNKRSNTWYFLAVHEVTVERSEHTNDRDTLFHSKVVYPVEPDLPAATCLRATAVHEVTTPLPPFIKGEARSHRQACAAQAGRNNEWVVSIVSQCGDFLWQTMETFESDDTYVRSIADRYLTDDGKHGRLAELFGATIPIVFHTHWQSLFSNGRKTGLLALAEVGKRVKRTWGDKVKWTTCYELTKEIASTAKG